MKVLFWISFIITIVAIFYKIIFKKNYFSIYTYTLIGVYFPLVLSFANWSDFHIQDKSSTFYYIFFCLNAICLISMYFISDKISSFKNIKFEITKKKYIPLEIYNIIYILCILIENKYISGYFFPSIRGIDIHTQRMPFIYFITTATYIVVIGNIIEFIATKKLKYIIYAIVCLFINIFSKSARIDAFLCLVQTGSFLMFFYLSKEKKIIIGQIIKYKKKSRIALGLCIITIVVFVLINGIKVGNNRMNSNGVYSLKYSDGIRYKGPEFANEIIPYYYGYFALSFDNLDYDICNAETKNNFVGLNSFRCVYFGIMQLDNIFNWNGGESSRANIIRCKAAAVPTIFWDFYYDYDVLIFIPIIITYLLTAILTKKLLTKQNIFYYIVYFYWVPMWMFASFDNRIYDFQIIWHILIIWVIYRRRFKFIIQKD